jgi:hypothetical protein
MPKLLSLKALTVIECKHALTRNPLGNSGNLREEVNRNIHNLAHRSSLMAALPFLGAGKLNIVSDRSSEQPT